MFSLDPHIVEHSSTSQRRMEGYASLVNELSIVLLSKGGSILRNGNLSIYPTSKNRGVSFFYALFISFRILYKKKCDLITTQDPFIVPLIAYPLAILFRLPLQVQVHSTFLSPFWQESLKNTLYQFLAKFFLTKAVFIRVVSERIKISIIENLKVPPSNIFLLPIFTDTKRIVHREPSFTMRVKYPHFDFVLLIASRLVKQKNIELAINAFKILVKENPRMGLIIVGSGPCERELKEHRIGFENNIVFESWSNDLPSYYKGADVFLLTSNYEGWAMTIIEAMATGTAVIMTDVGCAGEVVKNGLNGVIIPIGDQDALVKAIERLYRDPTERKRLGDAGQKTVLNMTPRTWKEYLMLYKKSLEYCIEIYKKEHQNRGIKGFNTR